MNPIRKVQVFHLVLCEFFWLQELEAIRHAKTLLLGEEVATRQLVLIFNFMVTSRLA